jgi:hypothetical protein
MKQDMTDVMKMLGEPTTQELEAEAASLMGEAAVEPQVIEGKYSPQALAAFVAGVNKALEVFGAPPIPAPPANQVVTQLPPVLVTALEMISQAIADAVEAEVLEMETLFDVPSLVTDTALQAVAGRIALAMRSREFRKWLKDAPAKPAPMVEEAPATETVEDLDALFASRAR